MTFETSEWSPAEPDFELLGLKYALEAHLAEHGIEAFQHYDRVEVDCGNGELAVYIGGPRKTTAAKWQRVLSVFRVEHHFGGFFYSAERHKYSFKNRAR